MKKVKKEKLKSFKKMNKKTLKFNKSLLNLSWNMIPLGVESFTLNKAQNFNWDLKELPNAIFFDNKDIIMKTILTHFISSHDVNLYFFTSDPKSTPFNEIKFTAKKPRESYEILKILLLQIYKRIIAMGEIGLDKLPLDGVIDLDEDSDVQMVSVNNILFKETDVVHIKYQNEEKDILAGNLQPGMKISILGDKDLRIPAYWESVDDESLTMSGTIKFNPIIFICDDYDDFLDVENETKQYEIINEIKTALPIIASLGNPLNIHLIFGMNSKTKNFNTLFPQTFKDLFQLRLFPGKIIDSVGKDIAEQKIGNSMYYKNVFLSYKDGEVEPLNPYSDINNYFKRLKNVSIDLPPNETIPINFDLVDANLQNRYNSYESRNKLKLFSNKER